MKSSIHQIIRLFLVLFLRLAVLHAHFLRNWRLAFLFLAHVVRMVILVVAASAIVATLFTILVFWYALPLFLDRRKVRLPSYRHVLRGRKVTLAVSVFVLNILASLLASLLLTLLN